MPKSTRPSPPLHGPTAEPASPGETKCVGEPHEPLASPTPDLTKPAEGLLSASSGNEPRVRLGPPGYELDGELGRGGMGIVYRAHDLSLNRDVAVKILQDKYTSGSFAAHRFLEEARITGQLQHPGIPPIHAVGTLPDGRPFLAMKLIKGRTLDEILKDRVSTNRGMLIAAFEQVCQAVAYAHNHGVIHRDLKPQNVMVGAFGEIQVMDWGLAKFRSETRASSATTSLVSTFYDPRDETDENSKTRDGSFLGTPAYMSPEQAIGAVERIDERSDVFGLGAVLCTILTGEPPFVGETAETTRLLAAQGKVEVAFARLDACGSEPELIALCKQCLSVDQSARPVNAGEVAKAVAELRAEAEDRARRAEMDRIRTEEQRKRRRVQITLAVTAFGLVAVAGFGVAVASMWQRAERAKHEADFQRQQAEEEKQITEGLRVEADRQRLMARQYLYYSRVSLASRSWNDAQLHQMGNLLEQERAQLPGEDLRGFEWHYLWRIRAAEQHVLRGHTDFLESVAWSPDGTRLASGSKDMTVRIWNADAIGPSLLTLKGHAGTVHDVAFSPDGHRLATASSDRTVKVWDAESGQEVRTLRGHTALIICLSWSPDGRYLASASWDATVRIWDTRTWRQSLIFKGHRSNVGGVSFSPDGNRLASASTDRTVKVWDARTGEEQITFTGHTDGVLDVTWSPDGKSLASASFDKTVRFWNVDAKGGKEGMTLRGHTGVIWKVRFSPNGRLLASASRDGTARLWETATGSEYRALRGHTGGVRGVAFRPDGERLASASFDKTVRGWDINADQDSMVLRGHRHWVWGVAFSPNGRHLASVSLDKSVKVWDVATGQERQTLLGHKGWVTGVAYTADGQRLATSSSDGTVKVWDAATGQEERTLVGHRGSVFCVAFSPDGKYLVSATGTLWYADLATRAIPAEVKVWRVSDWHEVSALEGHTGGVTSLSFSPDGERLATASYDGTVRVWEMATGRESISLKWPASWPSTVAFRPDGKQLATGTQDGTLQIWDAVAGRELKSFQGHTEDILGITYSPDGTRLASASHDGTLKLWDPILGFEVLTLNAHKTPVMGVVFSPDGRRLASASQDSTVRIWDATPLPVPALREVAPPPREVKR